MQPSDLLQNKTVKISLISLAALGVVAIGGICCLGGEADPLAYETEKGILSEDYVVKDPDLARLKAEICNHNQRRLDGVESINSYPYLVKLLQLDIGLHAQLAPSDRKSVV